MGLKECLNSEVNPVKIDRAVVTPSSSRPRSDTASSTSTVITAGPGSSPGTSAQESGVDVVHEGIDVGKGEDQSFLPLEAKPESESGCTIS